MRRKSRWPRLRRRRRCASRAAERARQRVDRPLERQHLLARRVHEVDVFGQAACATCAPSPRPRGRPRGGGGSPPRPARATPAAAPRTPRAGGARQLVRRPDLALPLLPRPMSARRGRRVELPQRAVEVVGAADGAPRLHAGERGHGHRREPAQLVAVHRHQRVEQHRGQLLARHRGPRRRPPVALARPSSPPRAVVDAVLTVDAGRVQREVHVEDGLERVQWWWCFTSVAPSAALNSVALGDVDVLDGAHRVEVLGHRHGKPRGPQLVHEPLQASCRQAVPGPGRRSLGSFRQVSRRRHDAFGSGHRAPCGPSRCRTGTSAARGASRRSPRGRSRTCPGRAACGPSRSSRRSTAPSSGRAHGSSARPARPARRARRRSRARTRTMSFSRSRSG